MTITQEKVVRANFTVLQSDLELITEIKKKCLLQGIETNKSELIRAGLAALAKLSDNQLRNILTQMPKPKVGGKGPFKSRRDSEDNLK